MSNCSAFKRLKTDLKKMQEDPPPGISAAIAGDNLFEWDAILFGPGGTCFDGGIFRLKLKFPENYPERPPQVWFYSRMFHPNVYPDGRICLDLLGNSQKWSTSYDTSTVLISIQALLGMPNPLSPANHEARRVYENNRTEYERRVLEIVYFSQSDGDSSIGRNYNESSVYETRCDELKF